MNRIGNHKGDRCDPAASVIGKFGGVRALARELSIDASALSKWQTSTFRSGAGGIIPARYHVTLLALAEAKRIRLTPADLIGYKARHVKRRAA